MSDIEDLYQQIIMRNAREPANAREVAGMRVEALNPLCGDEVVVTARVDGQKIAEVGAVAVGCALAKASASLMTLAASGQTAAEIRATFARLEALLKGGPDEGLGDLAAFAGVAKFPSRARCVTLAWQALLDAIRAA